MSTVGERELRTQLRVVEFFRDALGYNYLGHWKNRPDNANVEGSWSPTGWSARGTPARRSTKRCSSWARRPRSAAARRSTTPTAKSTACSATA